MHPCTAHHEKEKWVRKNSPTGRGGVDLRSKMACQHSANRRDKDRAQLDFSWLQSSVQGKESIKWIRDEKEKKQFMATKSPGPQYLKGSFPSCFSCSFTSSTCTHWLEKEREKNSEREWKRERDLFLFPLGTINNSPFTLIDPFVCSNKNASEKRLKFKSPIVILCTRHFALALAKAGHVDSCIHEWMAWLKNKTAHSLAQRTTLGCNCKRCLVKERDKSNFTRVIPSDRLFSPGCEGIFQTKLRRKRKRSCFLPFQRVLWRRRHYGCCLFIKTNTFSTSCSLITRGARVFF